MAIIRPSSDIVTGWSSTGASSYGVIDETTADNADYISANSAGLITRVGLGTTTDPGVDTGHVLRYRADHDTSDGRGVIARVVQTGSFPFIVTSKQPWRRQPQVAVGINKSNVIGASVKVILLPSVFMGNILTGDKMTNAPAVVGTRLGVSAYASTSPQIRNVPVSITAYPYSYFVIQERNAAANWVGLSSTVDGLSFSFIRGDLSGTDTVTHQDDNNMVASWSVSSGFHTYLVICDSSSYRRFYIDGKLAATSTSTYGLSFNRFNLGGIERTSGSWISTTGPNNVPLAGVTQGIYISDADARSFTINPWQIFRPIKRISYVDLGRKIIAERTPTLTTSPADYTIDLSEAEASGITDYSALAIEVEST